MQRSRVRTPSPALHHISKFTAENAEFAEGKQEKTIFDNRTQMTADNQDFKYIFGTKPEVKRKAFDNLRK